MDSNKQIIIESSQMKLEVEGKEIVYIWLIKDFTLSKAHVKLESPEFPIGIEEENRWKLSFNTSSKDEEYLALGLRLQVDDKLKRQTHLSVSIIDKEGKDHFLSQKLFVAIAGDTECRCFKKFAKKSSVIDLLNNGVLTVKCKLLYINNIVNSSLLEFEQTRLKNFESLLENKNLSDVVLVVGNKEFQAHKCILSAQSKVFAAMFEHDMLEKNRNIVKINDIQPNVMEKLLHFLYTGKCESFQNTEELFVAADKYELEDLKMVCEEELLKILNINNVGPILILADRYRAKKLKKYALKFISLHGKEIDFNKLEIDVEKQSSILIDIIHELLH